MYEARLLHQETPLMRYRRSQAYDAVRIHLAVDEYGTASVCSLFMPKRYRTLKVDPTHPAACPRCVAIQNKLGGDL